MKEVEEMGAVPDVKDPNEMPVGIVKYQNDKAVVCPYGEGDTVPTKTLAEALSDGLYHPVVSMEKMIRGMPATLWVSEKPEDIHDPKDLPDAHCYQVVFTSDVSWNREGMELVTSGHIAALGPDVIVRYLSFGKLVYIYDEAAAKKREERDEKVKKDEAALEAVKQTSSQIVALAGDAPGSGKELSETVIEYQGTSDDPEAAAAYIDAAAKKEVVGLT